MATAVSLDTTTPRKLFGACSVIRNQTLGGKLAAAQLHARRLLYAVQRGALRVGAATCRTRPCPLCEVGECDAGVSLNFRECLTVGGRCLDQISELKSHGVVLSYCTTWQAYYDVATEVLAAELTRFS